jgi:hypothetical protein
MILFLPLSLVLVLLLGQPGAEVHAARRDAWRSSKCPTNRAKDCEARDREMKAFIASHVPHDLEHNGGNTHADDV